MLVLDEDDGGSGKGAGVGGARGTKIGQLCLSHWSVMQQGREAFSNDIKANKYRTWLFATYTTLDMCAQTMFVCISQQ